jgi:hypothetical protein
MKANPSGEGVRQFMRHGKGIKKLLWRSNLALFFSLFVLIFLVPVIRNGNGILVSILLATVAVSGVYAAEYKHSISRLLFILASLVVLFLALTHIFPESRFLGISGYLLLVVSLILYTLALISHIMLSDEADKATILCAINAYMLIGLAGSLVLLTIDIFLPESFPAIHGGSGTSDDFIYFGFVTLTTLGYGDITPDGALARSMSTLLALAGQLYLVIIMALIIGKYLNSRKKN